MKPAFYQFSLKVLTDTGNCRVSNRCWLVVCKLEPISVQVLQVRKKGLPRANLCLTLGPLTKQLDQNPLRNPNSDLDAPAPLAFQAVLGCPSAFAAVWAGYIGIVGWDTKGQVPKKPDIDNWSETIKN